MIPKGSGSVCQPVQYREQSPGEGQARTDVLTGELGSMEERWSGLPGGTERGRYVVTVVRTQRVL